MELGITNPNKWILLVIVTSLTVYNSFQLQAVNNYPLYCTKVPFRKVPSSITSHDLYSYRVKCYNPELINSIDDIYPASLPADTVNLDLSGNRIIELSNSSFSNLKGLDKLNLGDNQINIINQGAFRNLENLKFLNLSFNHLRAINNATFESLVKLEKLLLVGNFLSKLDSGTFDNLFSIKRIDLSQNPLICDCHLHWMVTWNKANTIHNRTTCQYPSILNGTRIFKVKSNQWHCDWPLQVPYFVLQPSHSQVVFSGDPLQFQCQVSNVDSPIGLFWTLNNREVEGDTGFDDVMTQMQSSVDGMLLLSSLSVQNLTELHTGTWTCWFRTLNGNETRSVFIRVLSESTRFCSETVTSSNKGNYLWPRTVAGVKVELPCWTPASTVRARHQRVTYSCNERGVWEQLDTSKCPYVNEVTKVLEHFAKTNLNITGSSVIESVHGLKNYTGDGKMLTDKMDVVFIARTVTKYLDFVPKYKEIADILIDIAAVVMSLNEHLLRAAQLEDRACSKLVEAIEKLPELTNETPSTRYSTSIAIEDHVIDASGFQGITCASFIRNNVIQTQAGRSIAFPFKKILRCLLGNASHQEGQDDEMLEASIHLPPSLFHFAEFRDSHFRFQTTVYKNSVLFPQQSQNQLSISSVVIGGKLTHISLKNLTEPIFVTLRSPHAVGEIVPVWWNFSANDNFGEWSKSGCQLRSIYGNLVSFQCDRLGNYGLLQDLEKLKLGLKGKNRGAEFRIHHPVLYVGSAICVHCLLGAIITYVLGFRLIHIPKKNKHSLINICVAISLLCLVFTLGIRHTEEEKICQGVGLVLHYLTLVSLLWLVIIASNTYKKLNRSDRLDSYSDEPVDYPIPPKPMLRFYLVGWGIPVIICGISAAVNLEDYAGHDYCFLAITHSVGAFFGPCALFLFILTIFYLLIFCSIKRNSAQNKRESIIREGNEIEILETTDNQPQISNGFGNHAARPSSETSSEEDDLEHSPSSQLRAQIVALLLFLLSWASAAVSTTEPFSSNVFLSELLFGCAYAASAISFGVFILVFHCATREDVRLVWKMLYHCRESGIVRETVPLPQSNTVTGAGVSEVRRSNDSLNSSYTSKSCSTNHSVDGAKARLPKVSNVDAALAMTGGVTDTSWSGEMFFNPYQNGVARKYFKKRAKQMQRSKNEYPILDEEQIVEVNPLKEVDKLLPVLMPTHIKERQAMIQNTSRAVQRDPSTESQLHSSSSQGLVSMSPSLSMGNRSDRSLLIVEEEEEEDEGNSETSQKTTTQTPNNGDNNHHDFDFGNNYMDVDWGESCVVSPNEMHFSPPEVMDLSTPTPTEPQTKDISITCDLNDYCEGNLEAASEVVSTESHKKELKIGSEGDLLQQPKEFSSTVNGIVDKLPQRSGTLPRSNWERQFELSRRSNQPIYAYVNHSHHQNLASVLDKSKSESLMTRSASVGDTELVALNNENKQAKLSQPCLQFGRLVLEQLGKKETAV